MFVKLMGAWGMRNVHKGQDKGVRQQRSGGEGGKGLCDLEGAQLPLPVEGWEGPPPKGYGGALGTERNAESRTRNMSGRILCFSHKPI